MLEEGALGRTRTSKGNWSLREAPQWHFKDKDFVGKVRICENRIYWAHIQVTSDGKQQCQIEVPNATRQNTHESTLNPAVHDEQWIPELNFKREKDARIFWQLCLGAHAEKLHQQLSRGLFKFGVG